MPELAPKLVCAGGRIKRHGVELEEQTGFSAVKLRSLSRDFQVDTTRIEGVGGTFPVCGRVESHEGFRWVGSSPGEWQLIGDETNILDWLSPKLSHLHCASVIMEDVTDGAMILAMEGPGVIDLLSRGSNLDWQRMLDRDGWCTRTRFAGISLLVCEATDDRGIWLVTDRSYGQYLYQWLCAASADL